MLSKSNPDKSGDFVYDVFIARVVFLGGGIMEKKFLTVKDVSEMYHLSKKSIYYYIEKGSLPYLRIGKHIRFETLEVLAFLKTESEKERAQKQDRFKVKKLNFKKN